MPTRTNEEMEDGASAPSGTAAARPSRAPVAHPIAAVLRAAERTLAGAGIETARIDAEVLLAAALSTSRAGLYARMRDQATDIAHERFRAMLGRRARREPLAYILGHKEFYSLDFVVGPAVLIPRPETEHLVETVVAYLADRPDAVICDVGTGSGCVAVALAHALPGVTVIACDRSRPALLVARQNAERHHVADRIRFVAADLLGCFIGTFDVIVSNPPYLRPSDARSPELDWEPESALAAGEDGMEAIAPLISRAPALLADGGMLVVEIGADQSADALALARAAGLESVRVQPDLAGIPRVLVGCRAALTCR